MALQKRKPEFLTELEVRLKDNDCIWVLESPLAYYSPQVGNIVVPAGFETDFASVPRVPFAYTLYGNRAHREGVIHDALFRKDFMKWVSFSQANRIFLEAMECRGKPEYIRYPMYWAVCAFSRPCYHKRRLGDKL
jgi:hypothetical protein